MTRSRTPFTQAEMTRIIKAVRGAGLTVTGVRIDAAGFTVLTAEAPADGAADREDMAAQRRVEAYLDATYGDDAGPGVRLGKAKR